MSKETMKGSGMKKQLSREQLTEDLVAIYEYLYEEYDHFFETEVSDGEKPEEVAMQGDHIWASLYRVWAALNEGYTPDTLPERILWFDPFGLRETGREE